MHQLVTVSGDGTIFVWDTRYEKIAAEELKHIGRSKHVPVEKSSTKSDEPKLLWAPIFKAPLKRTEGIGEISINKVCCSGQLPSKLLMSKGSELPGDHRSHFILGTEEGEVMFVDLCIAPTGGGGGGGNNDDEDDGKDSSATREFIRWSKKDHSRPPVSIQQSPFFPDIILTVSDWAFHIWQVGKDKPIYVSTNHAHYLTCGAWSPTRPAVVILADATGHLQIWDFTDTSTRPSAELKATHAKITSMEFMDTAEKANTNQQLLAIGDESGTLHVYEVPRNLIRPVPKEQALMKAFMDREWERIEYLNTIPEIQGFAATVAAAAPSSQVTIDFDDLDEPDVALPVTNQAPPTAGGMDGNDLAPVEDTTAVKRKAMREALKKEEEEFLKLEAMFVTELELPNDDIPENIRSTMLQLSDKEKEKLAKAKQ